MATALSSESSSAPTTKKARPNLRLASTTQRVFIVRVQLLSDTEGASLANQAQVQRINELKATIATLDSTNAKEAKMASTLFWALVEVDDEIERRNSTKRSTETGIDAIGPKANNL
jgi:hypothetical protein